MARITVEDCTEVPNRFELVVLAAERARNIASGAPLTIDRDNDKNPVIALREIAAKHIDINKLRDSQISSLQKNNKLDDITDENLYAENQEAASGVVDYADVEESDMFSPNEETDLDIDFSDDITDED